MSVKSLSRRIGRMIRRMTGLPLPVAQKMGKLIARDRFEEFRFLPDVSPVACGTCPCCYNSEVTINGPRGNVQVNYLIARSSIEKEYMWFLARKDCPPGKTVMMQGSVVSYI